MRMFCGCFILLFFISGCGSHPDDEVFVTPFAKAELIAFKDKYGVKSSQQFRKYDFQSISMMDFIRYLSSVKALDALGELKSKGYNDSNQYIPYVLSSKVEKSWIKESEISELMKLISSKQPAVPTMNLDAASFPSELSTVGIEAMHLIYYARGKEAAYVSNRDFCLREQQDGLVKLVVANY